MEHAIQAVKYAAAVLGGFVAYWLGGLDKLLMALIAFMAIDYCSGLLCAWTRKTISSGTGFRGIAKKVVQLSVVAVAFVIEDLTGGGLPLRELTIMFFVANEGLSILENAAGLGLPLPAGLKDALIQLKGEKRDGRREGTPSGKKGADSDEPEADPTRQ